MLAAVMHAALLAFLWVGVSWQNTQPVSVEAEVWDMKTEAAAPPPQPAPPPEPQPEPEPAPKVVTPPPVEQPVAPKPPDIALEREKQRKLREDEREKRELAEEKKARDKAEKLAEKKKAEEAERKAEELADKKAAEKLAAEKKKTAEKLAKAKEAAEDKKLKDIRDAEMRRITGAAGTAGTAAKSSAPRIDSGYLAQLTSLIKSNTNYAGSTDVPGNPKVVFRVELLPTGDILSLKKVKSSGLADFDRAVENGISKSAPLPKKKDGTVERSLEIGFSMKDLN